jgi:hypothetical protein
VLIRGIVVYEEQQHRRPLSPTKSRPIFRR